jgi:hypothetical protein
LINSIYISKVIQNEKNKINDFTDGINNLNKTKDDFSLKEKIFNLNINDKQEYSKFIDLHVHKIYFYDDIYYMLENFIHKKKINYKLDKENALTLGKFIENLINKFIKLSNDYPKLVKKVMETFKKK